MSFVDPATCLALAIYFEARNQPIAGQIAVAQTILNRVDSEYFPDDICSVVTQSKKNNNGKPLKNKCQFSFYCDNIPDKPKNKEAYEIATVVAYASMILRDVDITDGSLYYHATYVYPNWADYMSPTVEIADHVFYKK